MSNETFDSNDIESFILYNKRTVKKRGELFEVDKELLCSTLNKMNSYNYIQDRRERIVKKATRILAGITYHQPFYEANKQTALVITRLFLRRNGFNLLVGTTLKKDELYGVLTNTIRDVSIFEEVELYLLKRVSLFYQ